MKVRFMLDDRAFVPEYAHATDGGADLRSPDFATVKPGSSVLIDTGVHIEIPAGWVGMLKSKSGLNVNHSITSEGVIDAGYTGSIIVKLYNHGDSEYTVHRGDKITQICLMPVYHADFEQADGLVSLGRGNNGFGSTGR